MEANVPRGQPALSILRPAQAGEKLRKLEEESYTSFLRRAT
jgi:hypothetical protein